MGRARAPVLSRSTRRAPALAALALLALGMGPARADCLDWSDADVTTVEGTLRGLPPGPVRWRAGTQPAGFGHRATQVELLWTGRDGQPRRQPIFSGMQDSAPTVIRQGAGLALRVEYCPQGQSACRTIRLPFAWDRAQARFAGASAPARQALAQACGQDQPAGG